MNPRTPEVLSRLVGNADKMVRDQDAGKLRPDEARKVELGQIYGELRVVMDGPEEATSRGYDEAAVMLAECLIHLDERCGPLRDTAQATRWAMLARSYLPFVRSDFALALTTALHTTSEHHFKRS